MNALGIAITSSTNTATRAQARDLTLFRIQLLEEPLRAHNVTTILSALTELYTKCWLIHQHRFADVIQYAQTRETGLTQEAGLIITRITQNSPANFDFQGKVEVSPQSVAEAMKISIDAVSQAAYRRRSAELDKQQQEAQSAHAD